MTKQQRRVRNISVHMTVLCCLLFFNNCSGFTASEVSNVNSQLSDASKNRTRQPGPTPAPTSTPPPVAGATPAPAQPVSPAPAPAPTTISFNVTSAGAAPQLVAAGQTVMLTAALQASAGASGINVDFEIRDQNNNAVAGGIQKVFGNESFASQQSKSYSWSYVVPSTLPSATYCLVVAAFDSQWAKTYTWNSCATSFTVQATASALAPAPVVTPPSPATGTAPAPSTLGFLTGVNLAGADTNSGKAGAQLWTDYAYPNNQEIDYFASKGFKVIRIPFDANRLQPQRNGSLSATELSYLDPVVNYVTSKGMKALLDPHNYGYLNDNSGVSREIGVDPLLPSSMLADFWSQVAQHYLNNSNIIFGLMNEPHDHSAAQWKAVAVDSVNAIRATSSKQMIFIPGTAWTGAHSWVRSGNASAWSGFTDTNFAYEMHQYLDSDSSGTSSTCVVGNGSTKLVEATGWLRTQNAKAFLGEIGWANNSTCMTEGNAITKYMSDNRDAWSGYTYWAAGPWWGEYMYTLEPTGLGTATVNDRAQLSILLQYK